jgi:hypothetical protein
MIRAIPTPRRLLALLAGMLSVTTACTKQPSAPAVSVSPSDHVAPSPVGTSQTILQKTFAVKTSTTFPFEIPAHAVRPHLHGIYQSFVGAVHGATDDSANLDFLIVNQEQYADLLANRPSEALFSIEASHNQAVNFDLPASMNQPVKYYLVFRSPSGSGARKVVEANFRVDF